VFNFGGLELALGHCWERRSRCLCSGQDKTGGLVVNSCAVDTVCVVYVVGEKAYNHWAVSSLGTLLLLACGLFIGIGFMLLYILAKRG